MRAAEDALQAGALPPHFWHGVGYSGSLPLPPHLVHFILISSPQALVHRRQVGVEVAGVQAL